MSKHVLFAFVTLSDNQILPLYFNLFDNTPHRKFFDLYEISMLLKILSSCATNKTIRCILIKILKQLCLNVLEEKSHPKKMFCTITSGPVVKIMENNYGSIHF